MHDHTIAAAPAERRESLYAPEVEPRRARLRRRLFEFFNSGPGRMLSAPAIDLHFRLWKLRHGASSFGEYYARSIALELERGGTHKTLGGKAFLAGTAFAAPAEMRANEFHARGRGYFEAAVRAGLKPHHVCADYGCGSLRVGQHLIAYLDPGNYWGLDLVSDFYQAGLPLLPPGLAAAKRPRFRPIAPGAPPAPVAGRADFIVSFAVMKHVPPRELAAYFAGIAALMRPGATALITFSLGHRTRRAGAKIWIHDSAAIAAALGAVDAGFSHGFRPPGGPREGGATCLTLRRSATAAANSSPSHLPLTTGSRARAETGGGSKRSSILATFHDQLERNNP